MGLDGVISSQITAQLSPLSILSKHTSPERLRGAKVIMFQNLSVCARESWVYFLSYDAEVVDNKMVPVPNSWHE